MAVFPLTLILGAYLLGAIPFGYLIVRWTQGEDIRRSGSGNIGATNVFRSASKLGGVATLLLDAGKGYLAVWAVGRLVDGPGQGWAVAAALAAIAGHVFPVFLRFRGGKGVAVGCGAYLALSPEAVLCALAVFGVVVAVSRYVSLGSILAAVAYPVWAYVFGASRAGVLGGVAGAILIVLKHRDNIRRLFQGNEHKLAASGKPG